MGENGLRKWVYSCEVCGLSGLSDEKLRVHMQKSHIQNYSVCPFCELVDDSADVIMIHVNEVHLDYLSPQAETIDDSEISEYGLEKQKRDSVSLLSNQGCSAVKKASSEENKNLDLAPHAMSVDVDLTCNAVGEGAVRRRPPKGNKGSSPSRSKNRRSYGGSPSEGVKRLIRSESNSPCHGFSRDDQELCEVDPNSNYSQSCHSSPSRSQLSLELPYNEQGNPAKRRELFASYRSNSTPQSISGNCKTRSTPPVAKAEDITPVNEVVTQCPICGFFEADPNTLEKHINSAHFDVSTPSEVSVSGGAIASAPADLKCPICSAAFSDPPDLELHVNVMHRDILSPATPTNVGTQVNSSASFDLVCPVCSRKDGFSSTESLSAHIDSHFNKTPTNHSKENLSPSAVKAMERERIYNQNKEQKEFNKLQAQYGMDNRGSYKEQYVTNMEKSLSRGEMSVVDYHEKRIMINRTQRSGLDDGCTKTKALCRRINLLSNRSREIASVHLCTTVDHYSGTAGDRGWGCGYRNIQMLLSSLQHHTGYYERLSLRGQDAIPSIEEIQRLIERAWEAGFDRMGAQQLGGKLLKTRKWIGATEVSALMAHSRIKCELLDFHKPSSVDGTHPEMFKWCLKYFSTKRDFTPPLYLQHQGHSRTIIGVEVLRYGEVTKNIQLLVLDPSTPPMQMARIFKDSGGSYQEDNLNKRVMGLPPTSPRKVGYTCSGQKVVTLQDGSNKQKSGGYYNKQDDIGYGASALRLIRKPLRALRAKQYQLVAVTGLINTEEERELSKVLVSTRIPKS